MVNREDFLRLITRPNELTAMQLHEIEEASRQFPYCQLIHFILAKAYYESDSPEAVLIVKKAAIYATQREGLKIFLHNKPGSAYEFISSGNNSIKEEEEKIVAEELPTQIIEDSPEIEIKPIEKKNTTIDLKKFESTLLPPHDFEIIPGKKNSVADDVLSGLKKLKNYTDHIDEPGYVNKITDEKQSDDFIFKFSGLDIVQEKVEGPEVANFKEEKIENKIQPVEKVEQSIFINTGADKTIADDVLADLQRLKKFTIDNEPIVSASLATPVVEEVKIETPIEKIEEPVKEEKIIDIRETIKPVEIFSENIVADQLKSVQKNNIQEIEDDRPFELGRLNEDDRDIIAFTQRLKNEKREKEKQIIENFITNEPRLSTLSYTDKEITSDKKDLSEIKTNPNIVLASENLANIMIKQGKIKSAIDILNKLILKNPEKSNYFATRISELKNQSTEN